MLYAFRDQDTWTAALCLGYVEWAARSVNQKIAWAGGIPCSGNVLLPEELVRLAAALSEEWRPNTVLDLYSDDGRFLNGICDAMPGIAAAGMEPDPILAMLTKIVFALRNDNVTIQNKHVFHACLASDYDLVFARFPFAEKPYADIQKDKDPKVSFLNCKLKADYSYVAKAVNAISSTGRAMILISENSLYNNIDKGIHYSLMIISSGNSAVNMVDGRECIIGHGRHKSLDVEQILGIVRSKQDHYVRVGYDDIKKGAILSAARYFQEDIKLTDPVPLCKIGTSYRGYQYNAKLQEEGKPGEKEYGLLKLSDIGTESIDFDSLATFDGDKNKMERYVLQENDIVLTARVPTCKTCQYLS